MNLIDSKQIMAMAELTFERANYLMSYEEDSGALIWKVRVSRRVKPGMTAGSLVKRNGYIALKVDGRHYLAHRVAYLIKTGRFPKFHLDHRDGVRHNNSWANLRDATRSENNRNAKTPITNTSGVKGVNKHKKSGKWCAEIHHEGRTRHLGLFDSLELAKEFRQLAADLIHGEFVRHA